jgi:hypothetical protein
LPFPTKIVCSASLSTISSIVLRTTGPCWTQAALSYVAKLLSLSLEDYRREPFEIDLYVAALYQRMDKYLPARHFLMRPWLWLIRRAAIAMALTSFESIRAGSFGHAHIAVFRKSSE